MKDRPVFELSQLHILGSKQIRLRFQSSKVRLNKKYVIKLGVKDTYS